MREKYIHTMDSYESNCIEKGNIDFEKYIADIETILNLQDDMLAAYCAIAFIDGGWDEFRQMSIAILSKNLNHIYNALTLNKRGEYAAARIIFRNVYESLIILKTVSLTDNQKLLDNWMNGDEISLRREIFSKITHPQSEPMKMLWNDLCRFCHGTVFSVQESFDYNYAKSQMEYNYIVITMLLYMNYHVLNRYVFSEGMKAKADRYIHIEGDISTKEKRDLLREIFKASKQSLREEPQKVLTDFSKVWRLKK